jgi:hypothetical protein
MKRYFLTSLLLGIFALYAAAGLVTPDRAAGYAAGLLGMSSTPVAENGPQNRAASRNGATDPEYYVFNNPDGGWVMIAADDRVTPVLGYSENGRFRVDDMPDNISWWMEGVAKVIDNVRDMDMEAPDDVRKAWSVLQERYLTASGNSKTIKTALWDQIDPYNELCPMVAGDNTRSITGCVATAMAIVMRHNSWPAHGTGVVNSYMTMSTNTYIPADPIENHTYEWNDMPMTNANDGKSVWKAAQKRQVAQLMYDCGVSVEMDYTSWGSSASSDYIPNALRTYFSYSDKAMQVFRASYSVDEWLALMKDEIDAGRVVLYCGSGDAGGHAFVCDGYDIDNKKLSINWGWGGDCNGFFTLDLPATEDFVFSEFQSAIIGIAPNTADVTHNGVEDLLQYPYDNMFGLRPSMNADIVKGQEIRFEIGYFMNYTDHDVDKDFKVVLLDSAGTVRQEGWTLSMSFPASNGYVYSDYSEPAVLTVTPQLTDYFKLFVKNGNDWVPATHNHDVVPDAKGICCGISPNPLIVLPDACTAGQEITLSLTLGFVPVKSVKWSLNGKEIQGNKVTLVQGENVIKADVEYHNDTEGAITAKVITE